MTALPDSTTAHIRVVAVSAIPDLQQLAHLLSPDETARAARYVRADDYRRAVVGRGILRQMLGDYLDLPPRAVPLRADTNGKPQLAPPHNVQFNIAHSGDIVVLAFARTAAIGVDVEHLQPQPDLMLVARQFFAASEVAALDATPENERLTAFYRCWTRKEAYLKAEGVGLRRPLASFRVSLAPDARTTLIAGGTSDSVLHTFVPAKGYIATIATTPPVTTVLRL